MKRSSVVLNLSGLALAPVIGLIGLLLTDDHWDLIFLFLASLPLILGVGFVVLRRRN